MPDRKGGCLCGAVRYVLKGEPRSIALCHCTHCQRQSGSLFSFNLVLRESDYEQSGETMIYVDSGDSDIRSIAISAGAAVLRSP
jgi:hypothetical protein